MISNRFCCCLLVVSGAAWSQAVGVPRSNEPAPTPQVVQDPLGRTTPRGTVRGFLKAALADDNQVAVQYLNTRLPQEDAAELAHQLFVVLDRRLPARLNELSDDPEGSHKLLTRPDQDLVGTVNSAEGDVEILLEKVNRKRAGTIWLFSRRTLDAVPDLYSEVETAPAKLPRFLRETRIGNVPIFAWLAAPLSILLVYLICTLLNHLLMSWIRRLGRMMRKDPTRPDLELLPRPVRLLVVAFLIRWAVSGFALPLLARQFWSTIATLITITASVWLVISLNRWGEHLIRRRLKRLNRPASVSILRLGRSITDFLAIVAGVLITLHHFGVNLTAALAGLGVGGIAVALAAQKTLENVIGGISVIFDEAVRVGDMLRIGEMQGVVEDIGLRSTRIRTLDRTLVSVPNGQLANANLENCSARDKFWLHHTLCLRLDTTAAIVCSIVEDTGNALAEHALVEASSVRTRLLRLGPYSLEIEIFAYVSACDWDHFVEVQQLLLLRMLAIVEAAGARLALPSQTTYLAADASDDGRRGRTSLQQSTPEAEATPQMAH